MNITLASPTGIHQATDFRLTKFPSGRAPFVQSDASPKQITVHYGVPGWEAVIAYTGVGAWGRRDTCSWLASWLQSPPNPPNLSFKDMIERIRTEGTRWLAGMSPKLDRPHTFVIGGFVDGKPQVVLASNFEHFGRRPAERADPELLVSRMRPQVPRVVITGMGNAVSRNDRKLLRALARESADPKHIRRMLADVIGRASVAPTSRGTIGPSAMAYSMVPNDQGGTESGGEKYGEIEGDYLPHMIMNGTDLPDVLNRVLAHMGNGQQVPTINWHG